MANDGVLPVIRDGLEIGRSLTRRQMVQRLLAGAGAGAAWPLVAVSHPIHKLLADDALFSEADARMAAAGWKPAFLDVHQNELLVALAESIVPGSEKARVNRFIDLLLSVDSRGNQEGFLASLAAIESESRKRYKQPFAGVTKGQKNELLTIASKEGEAASGSSSTGEHERESSLTLHDHFENLKGWISGAYYSSKAGMRELGWTGDYVFENYPDCQHAEEHR